MHAGKKAPIPKKKQSNEVLLIAMSYKNAIKMLTSCLNAKYPKFKKTKNKKRAFCFKIKMAR